MKPIGGAWYRVPIGVLVGLAILAVVGWFAGPSILKYWDMLSALNQATRETATTIDQPALDWHTQDIDGKDVALSDYRGRVVVLDFWFRGCGWCMRMMPQMKDLADDFRGQPVAVLGVSTDGDPVAREVADRFALDHRILRNAGGAQAIHKTYHVTMWPTVLILDRQGVVRHVQCGYRPDARGTLGLKIRALLAEPEPVVLTSHP